MIYKEYFINSEFDDVWRTLQDYYNEPESVRNLYKTLFIQSEICLRMNHIPTCP